MWKLKVPVLQLLTPVIHNGLIYAIDTQNMLSCIDAKTGKVLYSQRMKNKHYASPICATGRIYFTSAKGETTVIKEGRKLDIETVNQLPGEVFATPAILRDVVLYRTNKSLYCIGK